MPEGTSRLLQGMRQLSALVHADLQNAKKDTARVTVHFRSITEKLTPHDTIFAFTKPTDLQDSTLSSACSLHTATASTKSSSESIPPRGLAEIVEDASEYRANGVKDHKGVENNQRNSLPREKSRESQTRFEEVTADASAKHVRDDSDSLTMQPSLQRARTISNVDKALPPIPGEVKQNYDTDERISIDNTDTRSIFDYSNYEARPSVEGRTSSQSVRPSTRDLYDADGYRQKIKLGPRPSTDSASRTENFDRTNEFRPVSTLPAGLRMPIRKATPQKTMPFRPLSQQRQRAFPDMPTQREKPPMGPVTPIHIPDRKAPIVSNGLLTPAKTPGEAKSPKITPEKRRLMKALQLRQKQLAIQKSTDGPGDADDPTVLEHEKSEVDESVLRIVPVGSKLEVDPELVHVAVNDLNKEGSRNVEASPISIPETSDGPSTQASSITDEEEIAAHNEPDSNTREVLMSPSNDYLAPEISEVDEHRGLQTDNAAQSPNILHEVDQPSTRPVVEGYTILNESNGPTHQAFDIGDDPKPKQTNFRESIHMLPSFDNLPSTTSDWLVATDMEVSAKQTAGQQKEILSGKPPAQIPEKSSHQQTSENDGFPPKEGRTQDSHLEKGQPEVSASTSGDPSIFAKDVEANGQAKSQLPPVTSSRSSEVALDRDIVSSDVVSAHDRHQKVFEQVGEDRTSHHQVHCRDSAPEVALPPIDENEEACLSPRGALSQTPPLLTSSISQTEPGLRPSQAKRSSQESELTATRPSTSDTTNEQQSERQIRRRGVVNHPKRMSSPEYSDEQFLSDDSFMEELKSATLQEAKPVSVSKSPIKPVFSRSDSEQRLGEASRAIRSASSPLTESSKKEEACLMLQQPAASSSRSFSANHSLWPENQPTSASMPKKIGVSSGISQRIKALEQLSSRPTSPQSPAPSSMSTFVTQRKTSFRSPPRTSDPKTDRDTRSRPNSAYPSPSPSPEAVKSNPFNNVNYAGYSRPESVSVTATIVRDTKNKTPEMPVNPSEPRTMDLHQSPLLIEHQKMGPPPLSPLKPPRPSYARYSSARSGSSSSTEQKVEIPQIARRDSFASILSRSSRAGSEAELPRNLSDSSLNGTTNRDENKEDKKGSRRSRLVKRMSSISSMSRRSIANALSPGPKEAPIIERQEPIAETPPKQIDMGDVNIQFPDTLVSLLNVVSSKRLTRNLAMEKKTYDNQ